MRPADASSGRYVAQTAGDLSIDLVAVKPLMQVVCRARGVGISRKEAACERTEGRDGDSLVKTKLPELWPKLTLDKRGRELYRVEVLGCLNFLSVTPNKSGL